MRIPHHLRRGKSGIFHFRIVIPVKLREHFGKSEIKHSLHTRDPREAVLLSYTLSARAVSAFRHFKEGMAYDPKRFNPDDPATWPSKPEDKAADMVIKVLPDGSTIIEADPGNKEDIRAARQAAVEIMREHKKLGTATASPPEPAFPALAAFDPFLRPCRLSQAIDEYLIEVATRKNKSHSAYRSALQHFKNWMIVSAFTEKDPWVHEISTEHVSKWRTVLMADAELRAANKRITNKHQQKALAADPELAKIKPEVKLHTPQNYLTRFSAFMGEMQNQHRFPQNLKLPTAGQEILAKKDRLRTGWAQFNEDEMATIFNPKNYASLLKPHEYWFPLLALLTGARREEIAQLAVTDVRNSKDGWIIDINDNDFRKLKTASSIRIIPLHPQLVELGFLDYIKSVKAVCPNAKRVFPYLRYDKHNGFGDVPGEAFARYLDSLGITEEGKVLHSLRKNANQRLLDNKVEEAYRCRMIGHLYETINSIVYASSLPVSALVTEVIPFLAFPELDLAALKRSAAEQKSLLETEMAAANKRKAQAERRKQREGVVKERELRSKNTKTKATAEPVSKKE
jgi:integrase/bifunctional DNA-binding transcriptional regulator/antitoxin component of YhaV-PrlF toxin-antitoxin module